MAFWTSVRNSWQGVREFFTGTEEEEAAAGQQREIQQSILRMLQRQDQMTQLITPYIFEEMGYRYDTSKNMLVKIPYEERISLLSPQEQKQFRMEEMAMSQQIIGMGYNPDTLTKFKDESELLSFLSPDQARLYNLNKEAQDYELKALRGELPVSPGLERELITQEEQVRGGLSQRLGPNYEEHPTGHLENRGIRIILRWQSAAAARNFSSA
jgi:hypothetical protein